MNAIFNKSFVLALLAAASAAPPILSAIAAPAAAFSQIQPEEGIFQRREGIVTVPLPPLDDARPTIVEPSRRDFEEPSDMPPAPPGGPAHTPDGSIRDQDAPPGRPAVDDDVSGAPDALPLADDDTSPLPVFYGDDALPKPVRDLRERLVDAARSGDIEKLRPYLEPGEDGTALSVFPLDGDPVEFLKANSGDGDGVELMAILLEVLESGHVRVDAGRDSEIYVWPYFTQVPLETLDKPKLVELFELVTAGDYQRMLENGAYDFYRVGISPEGRLDFFLMAD